MHFLALLGRILARRRAPERRACGSSLCCCRLRRGALGVRLEALTAQGASAARETQPAYALAGTGKEGDSVAITRREAYHCGQCQGEVTQYPASCHNCGARLRWPEPEGGAGQEGQT